MSDTKHARVEVPGLPYRVRSIADADEALEAFASALNRYLHNFSEGEHSTRSLKIISTNSERFINDHQVEQLEQMLGCSLAGSGIVQSVLNHDRRQSERALRLEVLLAEQGIHVDDQGFVTQRPIGT